MPGKFRTMAPRGRRPGAGAFSFRSLRSWVALVVALAAVIGLLVLATDLTRSGAGENDGAEAALPTTGPTREPTKGSVGDSPLVAFLGDSYTVGVGAGLGYVGPTAQAMGWTALNLGEGGTGYLNDGALTSADFGPYRTRIAQVVAAHPDIVIVQGSPNDVQQPGDLEAAAADVFDRLVTALPDARILVVGTTDPPSMDQAAAMDLSRSVHRAATDVGVTFIDPIDLEWLPRDDAELFVSDRLHPSAAGYEAYTAGLVAALREVLQTS
jgi:lysophospholipase L1-like esterase